MSEFFDKYSHAPTIRVLRPDEVRVGMVVRVAVDHFDGVEASTLKVKYAPLSMYAGADLIELLEDVPDPREELARRLYDDFSKGRRRSWDEATDNTREVFRRLAAEAMRWADERGER